MLARVCGASRHKPPAPHPHLGDIDPCILCGYLMHTGVERRYKQIQPLSALLQESCTQTPFVYHHIAHMARQEVSNGGAKQSERAPFCIACINWVRRLSNAKHQGR